MMATPSPSLYVGDLCPEINDIQLTNAFQTRSASPPFRFVVNLTPADLSVKAMPTSSLHKTRDCDHSYLLMEVREESEENVPYRTSKLAGTVNWGTATIVGVFAGMLYGGTKEASASVSKDAEVTLKLGSTPDKREQYRLMRDAMEKRFIRITRGSIVGGVRLGMFTAAFYGLQNFLAEQRGVHDVYNVVGAGSATAATFGLIMPGSLAWRGRNVLLGSVLGATVCFPLGWLHLKLVEKANEESVVLPEHNLKPGVGAAIERLGGNPSE